MSKFIITTLLFITAISINNLDAQSLRKSSGTTYEVLSVSYEWVQSISKCGSNDLGFGCAAQLKVEKRYYRKFNSKGEQIDSWYKTVKTFTGKCDCGCPASKHAIKPQIISIY